MKTISSTLVLFFLFGFAPGKLKYGKIAHVSDKDNAIVFYNQTLLNNLLLVEIKAALSSERKKEYVTKPEIAITKIIELEGKYYLYIEGKTNRIENEIFQAHISLDKTGTDFLIKSEGNLNSFARSTSHMHFKPGIDEADEFTNGEYSNHGDKGTLFSSSISEFESEGLQSLFK